MIRNLIIPYRSVQLPTITSTSPLPTATSGQPYSFQFQATGGSYPYTWSSSGTGAFSLSASGLLTGTPVSTGTFTFTITARDSFFPTGGNSVSASFQIQVVQPNAPSITTTSPLPGASVGTFYSFMMSATGGTAPYTWAITSDTPNTGGWLSIDPVTGILSGTPGTAETETVTIKVTDSLSVPSSPVSFSLSVVTPGVYTFDHFISPTGDDSLAGTSPATAWSAGAITNPPPGGWNVLGALPGVYTGTQINGVFTRFYDAINNFNGLGNTLLKIPANGTVAGCDVNRNYVARQAIFDPSANGSNAFPPLRQGAVFNLGNAATLDGVVIQNFGSGAIGSVGIGAQVLNCYALGGVGPYGSIFNNAAIATTSTGVYLYNTRVTNCRILAPPAMTVTNITSTGCDIVDNGWGGTIWPYDLGGPAIAFALTLSTGQVIGTNNNIPPATGCTIANPINAASGSGYGGTHINFPSGTVLSPVPPATTTATPSVNTQGPQANYALYGQQGSQWTVEGCTLMNSGFIGIKTNVGQQTYKYSYIESGNFGNAVGPVNQDLDGFNTAAGNTTSLDHCVVVGPMYVMNLAGTSSTQSNLGTVSFNHCTFYTKAPATGYLRPAILMSIGGASSNINITNCLWGNSGTLSMYPLTAGVYGTFVGSNNIYNTGIFRNAQSGTPEIPTGPDIGFINWKNFTGSDSTSTNYGTLTNVFLGVPAPGNISTFSVSQNTSTSPAAINGQISGALDSTVGKNGVAVGVNFICIDQSTVPAAKVGTAYSTTLTAGGNTTQANLTWSMTASPDWLLWLSINSTTGVLSGTPLMVGTDAVTVTVTDNSTGLIGTAILMLTVNHQ